MYVFAHRRVDVVEISRRTDVKNESIHNNTTMSNALPIMLAAVYVEAEIITSNTTVAAARLWRLQAAVQSAT